MYPCSEEPCRTVIFIVECAHNMDNGYVEVWFTDGNMLRIKCEEVEAALRTTEQSLAKLHKLLDNKPIEYVAMALSGEMQAEYYGTAEPPVRCGESHLSGLTKPLHFVY